MKMRTRPALILLICCCAGLTACTAAASSGPDVTVSTPDVGRPQPPASAQAALSRDAFTPYAALGQSNNDGLAPNESGEALSSACMTVAGYPNSANVPFGIALGPANLAFSQPWGAWGYLGAAEAQQYGFRVPAGSALSALGIDVPGASNPASLPQAEQTALGKCVTITGNFTNAMQDGPLAGISTLSNDIYNDVAKDPAVTGATQAWVACMTRNGYSFKQPENVFFQELQTMFGGKRPITPGETVSPAADQAQIAAAVTDADCTGSTDLGGIYFAVEASYEQQIVNANAAALGAAVQKYRAAYTREVSKLPSLLKTASAQPFRPVRPGQSGSPTGGGRPTSAAG
jgi:hypothetical protein